MAASGWYDDPDGGPGIRFWDGSRWTEHRASAPSNVVATGRSRINPTKAVLAGVGVSALFLALVVVAASTSAPESTQSAASRRATSTSLNPSSPVVASPRPEGTAPATSLPPATVAETTTVPPPSTSAAAAPPTTAAKPAPTAAPTTRARPATTLAPVTTTSAATSGGCHPSYTPCVPIASDVDCKPGSGNGPAYVRGPITVIGADEYGLDADNDGIGCE